MASPMTGSPHTPLLHKALAELSSDRGGSFRAWPSIVALLLYWVHGWDHLLGQAWQAGSPDAWLGDDIPWLWALGSSRASLRQQGSWRSFARHLVAVLCLRPCCPFWGEKECFGRQCGFGRGKPMCLFLPAPAVPAATGHFIPTQTQLSVQKSQVQPYFVAVSKAGVIQQEELSNACCPVSLCRVSTPNSSPNPWENAAALFCGCGARAL